MVIFCDKHKLNYIDVHTLNINSTKRITVCNVKKQNIISNLNF